jgi:hypothetical protein
MTLFAAIRAQATVQTRIAHRTPRRWAAWASSIRCLNSDSTSDATSLGCLGKLEPNLPWNYPRDSTF